MVVGCIVVLVGRSLVGTASRVGCIVVLVGRSLVGTASRVGCIVVLVGRSLVGTASRVGCIVVLVGRSLVGTASSFLKESAEVRTHVMKVGKVRNVVNTGRQLLIYTKTDLCRCISLS